MKKNSNSRMLRRDKNDAFKRLSFLLIIWWFMIPSLQSQPNLGSDGPSQGKESLDQGNEFLEQGGEENLCLAVKYFNQAISKDATLTSAYLGLAEACLQLGPSLNIKSPEETRNQAIAAMEKAVSLDPYSVDVLLKLAEVKSNFEWDWDFTEKALKIAIALEPSGKAIIPYVSFLAFRDRNQEAIQYLKSLAEKEEVEHLEDWISYLKGDKSISLKYSIQQVEANPSYPYAYWSLALDYARIDKYEESVQALIKQMPMMGEDIVDELGLLGYNYGKLGQIDESLKTLKLLNEISEKGRYVSPIIKAWVYCGIGNNNQALKLIEEGFATHANRCGAGMKNFDFIYTSVSHESRFIEIMKKMEIELITGLP